LEQTEQDQIAFRLPSYNVMLNKTTFPGAFFSEPAGFLHEWPDLANETTGF